MSFGTLLMIVIIVLVVFGPEKVPEVGRALGRALREFRRAMAEIERSVDEHAEPVKKALSEVRDTTQAGAETLRNTVSVEEPKPAKPPDAPTTKAP